MTDLALTFPGGKLLTVTFAATAGNVVTNKSPGDKDDTANPDRRYK